MSKQTFEDFLMEKHSEQYIGTKHAMVDDSADWITNLDVDELIEFADKFQKQINAELLEACKQAVSRCEIYGQQDSTKERLEQAIAKAEGANQ